MANRKTTILAVTSLVAGGLLVVYLFKRNELRQTQRMQAGDGEFGESAFDEPFETGTFVRLELTDGASLVIEDASGKEQSFVCYDSCSPLDENTDTYIGKKVRVFWLATSDESDATVDPSLASSSPISVASQIPETQDRIAVRIELIGQ